MFGEKTEGIAYGAKHRVHHNYRMPTPAELNKSFGASAHWTSGDDSRPKQTNIAGPPPPPLPSGGDPEREHETAEYREWAEQVHRQQLYEQYKREQEEMYRRQAEEIAEFEKPFHEQSPTKQPHWTAAQQYDPAHYPHHTLPAEYAQQAQQYREQVHGAMAGELAAVEAQHYAAERTAHEAHEQRQREAAQEKHQVTRLPSSSPIVIALIMLCMRVVGV